MHELGRRPLPTQTTEDSAQPDDATALKLGLFYGLLRDDPSRKGILGCMSDSRGLRRKNQG